MARYIDVEIAKECFEPSDLDGDCFDNYDNVIRILNAVQTEDVTPIVRGKWIETQKGIIVTDYKCSICGRMVRDDTGYNPSISYPYCHCGAKMEESDEEE